MTTTTMTDQPIKAAISVSDMCRQLGMSRSQFYNHVKKGTFHTPLKLANGRPYFNASQAEDNIKARQTGIGVNGEYVLFYERNSKPKPRSDEPKLKSNHEHLIASLTSLGLSSVTNEQVQSAVESCFPKGTDCEDESNILRSVFKRLKRATTG